MAQQPCLFFERIFMIKVENLTITTRQPILKSFTTTFKTRNIYQIMAENGAGKSTFLKALTQLVNYKGLSLLIICHLTKLRRKYFSSKKTIGWIQT